MNNEFKGSLSGMELFSVLTRVMLGIVMAGIYRRMAGIAGRDAWISFLVTGLAVALASLLIIMLNRRFPHQTFFEYSPLIAGKWIGKGLNIFFILYLLMNAGVTLRFLGELVTTFMLKQTPLPVILVVGSLPSLYLARKNILTLARFSIIITLVAIPSLIFVILPFPDWDIFNILPIGGEGIGKIASAVNPGIFAFFGYELLMIFYPYMKNKKKVPIVVIGTVGYVTFVYTLIMLATMLYFGPKEIHFVIYPALVYLNAIEIPVIERVDFFVFFLETFSILSCTTAFYYLTCLGFQQTFKKPQSKTVALWIYPLIFLIAWYPKNVGIWLDMTSFLSTWNIIIGIVIPILLLILAVILKRNGGVKVEKS